MMGVKERDFRQLPLKVETNPCNEPEAAPAREQAAYALALEREAGLRPE